MEAKNSGRILWGKKGLDIFERQKRKTLYSDFFPQTSIMQFLGSTLLSAISIPLLFLQVNFTCEFCHYLGGTGIALFYRNLNVLLLTGAGQRARGFGQLPSVLPVE